MAALPLRSRWALGLSLFAVAWGLALIAAVFVFPAYNDGSTLAQENSAWVALPAAVPAVLASVALLGLHLRCTHGSRPGTVAAWFAIVLLLAFAVVAILSIGLLALIPALLLGVAARLTPAPAT
jgi:hypothetical protein